MKIRTLTTKTLKPYGKIIDRSSAQEQKDGNGWGFVVRVRSKGWRIAYLVLRNRSFKRLECHDSPETFEPVKGRAVIALAVPGRPETYKLFRLDRPILLNKGIWHALFTCSPETHLKIVENLTVSSRFHQV